MNESTTPTPAGSPEEPERDRRHEQAAEPAEEISAAADETSTTPEAEEASIEQTPEEAGTTTLYVRRGRTPTLGFWVALAIGVPTLAGLVVGPLLGITVLSQIVQFALLVAVFVGLPLAALAALVDALRHRRTDKRRR